MASDSDQTFEWAFQPEESAEVPQRQIGPYLVQRRIGAGGMGEVLEVLDPSGRTLALKLLRRVAPERRQLERFRREGELTAALRHPNVVRIHDAGVVGSIPYLVYEHVAGEDLDEACAGLSRERRLEIVLQVARGLAHAHAHGIVHRDLKASNVLLGEDGRVLVADFGLALGTDLERLTVSGALVGTPSAMAPEQVRGERERYGPATDVWALGVLLYRMLTDRDPFSAPALPGLLSAILDEQPQDPARIDPSLSPSLSAVCLTALRKEPEERYPDAGAFAGDLAAAIAGERVQAPPPSARAPLRGATGRLVALALLVGLLLGAGVLFRRARLQDQAREALIDHARWETEALSPIALVLPSAAPPVTELTARRARLLDLGELREAAPHLELLDAHLRLARGEPAGPGAAHKSATQLTVDALLLARAGEDRRALALLERALRRDPSCRRAQLTHLLLVAGSEPGALLGAAEAQDDARQLLLADWQRHLRSALKAAVDSPEAAERAARVVRCASREPAARSKSPLALRRSIAAEELLAQVRDTLDAQASSWATALRKEFAAKREGRLVDRLEQVLQPFAPAQAGPRLSAALGRTVQELAATAARDPSLVKGQAARLVDMEVRLFYLCLPFDLPFQHLELARFSLDSPLPSDGERRLRLALAALRVCHARDTRRLLGLAPDAAVSSWIERRPGSAAGYLLRASRCARAQEQIESLQRALAAPGDDLHPNHRAFACAWLAGLLLERLRQTAPADQRPAEVSALSDEVLALWGTRGSGSPTSLSRALEVRVRLAWLQGGEPAGLEAARVALEDYDRRVLPWKDEPTPRSERLALECVLGELLCERDPSAAWSMAAELLDRARAMENRTGEAYAARICARAALACGREAELVARLESRVPVLARTPVPEATAALRLLARAYEALGQGAKARSLEELVRLREEAKD